MDLWIVYHLYVCVRGGMLLYALCYFLRNCYWYSCGRGTHCILRWRVTLQNNWILRSTATVPRGHVHVEDQCSLCAHEKDFLRKGLPSCVYADEIQGGQGAE